MLQPYWFHVSWEKEVNQSYAKKQMYGYTNFLQKSVNYVLDFTKRLDFYKRIV